MNTQIQEAILGHDVALVKHVLEIDPLSIHHTNEVGFTALMVSCTTEQPDIARILLDAGAIVQTKAPETGFSALHCAVAHPPIEEANTIELIDMLIKHGEDINVRSVNKETPLMFAAWFNNEQALRFLLKKGAMSELKDIHGRTAKDMALIKGNKRLAIQLGYKPGT